MRVHGKQPAETLSDGAETPPVDVLRNGLELLLFSNLNLAEDADRQLRTMSFGRTHHRILYFVSQTPGITVGELYSLLRVTPQNIQRPMRDLIQAGYVDQRVSMADRRQRQLYATASGIELADRLLAGQLERMARAYHAAGPEAVKGFWQVLGYMMEDTDRDWYFRPPERRAGSGSDTPASGL